MENTQAAKSSVLSQYFSEIREYPLLTKEEEQSLARDIQRGSREALDELVKSNLSFVAKVASEYRSLGLPFEDLLNEGNVGLIQAAQRFDPTKDNKFISYAIWWIRKAILKALSEKSHVVRMPYSQIKKFKEIRRAEKQLQRSLGRRPNREEISDHLCTGSTRRASTSAWGRIRRRRSPTCWSTRSAARRRTSTSSAR
jgi:RNA polymerase primary sigma factor